MNLYLIGRRIHMFIRIHGELFSIFLKSYCIQYTQEIQTIQYERVKKPVGIVFQCPQNLLLTRFLKTAIIMGWYEKELQSQFNQILEAGIQSASLACPWIGR